MTRSFRNFTMVACLALIIAVVGFLCWGGDNADPASREPAAAGRTPRPGKPVSSERGDGGQPEAAEPHLATKSRERPGPDEMAEKRFERRMRQLADQIESLKAGGLGHSHPLVKAKQSELDAMTGEAAAGK